MKKIDGKGVAIAGAAIGIVALAAGTAQAGHSWANYHWPTTDNIAKPPVVDNTVGHWKQRVAIAVADWNGSPNIQSTLSTATTNAKRCPMTQGTIQVCNSAYGNTGWLGIASISLSGDHIVAGSTKLNDTYFALSQYNTDQWKQLVTCQEIGHDYGLGHQNEDFNTDLTRSCMEYTNKPDGNEHPDGHDFDQLAAIYGHSDGGSSGGGGPGNGGGKGKPLGIETGDSPADWGTAIGEDAHGRANKFVRNFNGYTIVTHVTWTIEASGGRGDRGEGQPRKHSGDHYFNF